MYIFLRKISYTDGELETQPCLYAEQKLLMISSVLAVKLATVASVNCIIDEFILCLQSVKWLVEIMQMQQTDGR